MSRENEKIYWIEIHVPGKGLVLKEEAVRVTDLATGRILAMGNAVRQQQEGEAKIEAVLIDGQVIPHNAGENSQPNPRDSWERSSMLLRWCLGRVWGRKLFKKFRVAVCLYPGADDLQKKAMEDAVFWSGAKKVELTEQPVTQLLSQCTEKDYDMILAIRSEDW